ncbi:MAG: efflux transporter outer membrane subunit [Pseudomonadota bacterium]|nr:efflux transporter outer membrane subunit [Pseudomonadota bacterium]
MRLSVAIVMSMALSACTVGPDYMRPKVCTPVKFKEAKKGWKIAKPRDVCNRGEWWRVFHDPKLNALENRLNCANQNIAIAAARYRQSLAIVDQVRADFYPVVSAMAAISKQKIPASRSAVISNSDLSTSSNSVISSSGGTSTNYSLSLNASWEPDLWGGVRRAVEASADTAQASAAQLALTRLSMQATMAQLYFQVRTLDLDQKVLNENVNAYRQALKLAQNRYNAGVAARADVIQAQSLLEGAESTAINNGVNRAIFEHAVAVLVGEIPSCFSLPHNPLNSTPPSIPLIVPSTLLERRPDIANAERLMAAANAEIGVAIAAYYPVLNLTASGFTRGPGLGPLFSLPTLGWALGAQLVETIFDGGLRNATTAAARANYEATLATYRQTVLAAFQDVEDNLSTLRILADQIQAQNRAVASARKSLQIIMNQYKAGTVTFTTVIVAETVLYNAEKNAADIAGQRMVAAVGLIKALGGGWDIIP